MTWINIRPHCHLITGCGIVLSRWRVVLGLKGGVIGGSTYVRLNESRVIWMWWLRNKGSDFNTLYMYVHMFLQLSNIPEVRTHIYICSMKPYRHVWIIFSKGSSYSGWFGNWNITTASTAHKSGTSHRNWYTGQGLALTSYIGSTYMTQLWHT